MWNGKIEGSFSVENPTECLWRWEPDCRSTFFFSPPAHLCTVTYMTGISLIETLNNQFTIEFWVYWCLTSHATIFQSYMWRHRCAGGLKKKLYLRSGSQRHRHFEGFFNVPVLHRHGTTLFIRWFRHTAPFNRLLRHAGDTEIVFST